MAEEVRGRIEQGDGVGDGFVIYNRQILPVSFFRNSKNGDLLQ
jgi:hypothetical protein